MRSTWWTQTARTAASVALLLAAVGVTVAVAKPGPERPARRRGFNLFAVTNAVMDVNRVFCGINNLGEVCVDPTNSPVVGGGFWPKGTPDQYVFNSGLQLAGIIPSSAGFAWAGDTVGAYFMDPRGTQSQGDGVTLVFNSLDPTDAQSWPNGAIVRSAALFDPVLLGRNFVSQQDIWLRTWEGNPAFLSGRTHPMGIMVEERGMAWNFPTGNEDIIYFVYTFYNITASSCAAYNNATIDPAVQAEVCAVGQDFQSRNEIRFGLDVPDNGYDIGNVYAAFFADMDVGDAGRNYSSAVFPFDMALAWKSDFLEANWSFPSDIFGDPFFKAPGFVGVKYLASPVGLTVFSNTRNAATGYPDPVGVIQLFRYLSGFSHPSFGDLPCTNQRPAGVRNLGCFFDQVSADTRFFMSSGPFTLPAGQASTIVVAYVHAAPVKQYVQPCIGVLTCTPGIPLKGDSIARGGAIRTVERIAGWVSHADTKAPTGVITQDEVTTVPRSLLNKALVAQAVFDNKFLLPFAPDPPPFFLVPGDGQVTVVWQTTGSETSGDPFYAIASNALSPLYDPNFREFDVEGYRIYRGRTTSELELIAQFDYAGTALLDFTGNFAYETDLDGDGRVRCAPELGLQQDCPDTDPATAGRQGFPAPAAAGRFVTHPLVGDVVQVKGGGRVALADSSVLILEADTAVTGGGSGFPVLADAGVPFAYIDGTVRNSFTYFYAVTAFDVNSRLSGPSALESPRITKAARPRSTSRQEVVGQVQPVRLLAANGSALTDATEPTFAATTGIFSKQSLPTDGIQLGLAAFLPQILADGSVTLTIDSVLPGAELNGRDPVYYLTAQGTGAPVSFTMPVHQDAFSDQTEAAAVFPATNTDQAKAARYGGDNSYTLFGSTTIELPGTWRITGWGRGDINGDPANSNFNGPRWYQGANETTADPNSNHCNPGSPGDCGAAGGSALPVALTSSASLMAGRLVNPGNDTVRIFHPLSYNTVPNVPGRNLEALTSTVSRAADMRVFWGTGGAIDSVADLTHGVRVPFSPVIRASWGILNQASFAATNQATTQDANNALLTWSDIYCVAPAAAYLSRCGGAAQPPAVLQSTAALSPIAMATSTYAGTSGLATTGNGFIFYINGHFFLMQMAALPPSGTQWNLRSYSGVLIGTVGNYTDFQPSVRPPAVPGLRAQLAYTGSSLDPTATTDSALARVHTVPDPYYVTNSLEITPGRKILKFVNLPAQAIVRIYSVSGVLVRVLTNNDPTGGAEVTWDLRNRSSQLIASGVYFFHVETPDGRSRVGRFTVVNFAQ